MPGSEVQAEIVEATASFHNLISEVIFPGSRQVFDNPVAFNPSDGTLDPDVQTQNPAVGLFLFGSEFFATGFLHRLDHGHVPYSIPLTAGILSQATPFQ